MFIRICCAMALAMAMIPSYAQDSEISKMRKAGRGFSLGESELVLSSNIDPYFRGQLIAALTPENEVEVEEAFFQTLALASGLTLKGGRFLSAIGYQNQLHRHFWDFQDAPLAYKAFLGGRWNDDGVQLRWVSRYRCSSSTCISCSPR